MQAKGQKTSPESAVKHGEGVPSLTPTQLEAASQIASALETEQRFLLEGVTGSGKSEVYAYVANKILAQGQQVLLLVPEIAIASHLVQRLQRYLGNRVAVWHSGLRPAERRSVWQRAISGEPLILVGPRSALFVPLARLSLVVLDEEHDAAYKQWDQEPRFHARFLAERLAHFTQCPLVLGSATPSIETKSQVTDGKVKILVLPARYGGVQAPLIELVDTRGSNSQTILAPASLEAIQQTLAQGLQTIVLINRRGTSPVLICADCGAIWRCPRCERALVVHLHPKATLSCHYCATTTPLPQACSECSSVELRFVGAGTERVEAELRSVFSSAHIGRLDADISRSRKRLAEVSHSLTSGMTDILVGTQLVAKSWDIERLHLVVVLNADQGLLVPDVRAHERTVQLLWQVAGRAGRRQQRGRVLIETARPDHPVLRAVVQQNYDRFIEQELVDRKRYDYPPFRRAVTFYLEESEDPGQAAAKLARTLSALSKLPGHQRNNLTVLPGTVRVQPGGKKIASVTCLTTKPKELYKHVPLEWSVDLDPESF